MRVALVVLTLQAATGAAGSTYTVRVPVVAVRLVPNMVDMPATCATTRDVRACTAFAGQQLACTCALKGSEWRISARAQYIPVLYLGSFEHRAHEELHIRDVDAALKNDLAELVGRRFASAAECEAAGHAASRSFEAAMDRFKRESNTRRHPPGNRAYHPLR